MLAHEKGLSLGRRDHRKAPVATKALSWRFRCLADIQIYVTEPPGKKVRLIIFVTHEFTILLPQQQQTGGLCSLKSGPRRSTDRLRSLECCAEMRRRGCVVHDDPFDAGKCEALLHVHSSRDCCLLLTSIPSR